MIASDGFDATLTEDQLTAWDAVKGVIEGFLGKNRNDDYKLLVQNMMDAFEVMNVNMSLKIHFLNNHMTYFARQLPTESDEQGERFHQTCKPFETRFKGKSILSLITDLCWSLIDDESKIGGKRQRVE